MTNYYPRDTLLTSTAKHGDKMKTGDLVRIISNVGNPWVGVVLETRTFPSMTIGRGHFREKRTEIRAFFSENPQMSEHFCNARFFEVISEAK